MQSLSFIRLKDKTTNREFVVATDIITYVMENTSDKDDMTCQVHYAKPNSEIDYVTDSIENIANSLHENDELALWLTHPTGRLMLVNPEHIMRVELGCKDTEIYFITLSDGTELPVQENLNEIFDSATN